MKKKNLKCDHAVNFERKHLHTLLKLINFKSRKIIILNLSLIRLLTKYCVTFVVIFCIIFPILF